jgi:hypothetical protein
MLLTGSEERVVWAVPDPATYPDTTQSADSRTWRLGRLPCSVVLCSAQRPCPQRSLRLYMKFVLKGDPSSAQRSPRARSCREQGRRENPVLLRGAHYHRCARAPL